MTNTRQNSDYNLFHNGKLLEVAIQHYKTEEALLLIRRGALVGEDLNLFLLMAIEKNNDSIVKMLIDHGIQNNPSVDLKIPLNIAISYGQLKIIEHILPHCQFLEPSDKYIPRELIINSAVHYKKCVELLLKWNFIISPDSNQDKDFIYTAVEKGYLSIVLQLLELGIDVNMMNSNSGLNLLKVACLHKHHEIVENLLKYNACVNVITPTDYDTLNSELSNYNGNCSLSSINNTNDLRNVTCLHIAVLNFDPMMTRLLLAYGALIIDDPTFFKITCMAVDNNCEEIVHMFLDYGVNVQDTDSEGMTLLHHCFNNKNSMFNISKLLLEKGATTHIQIPGNSLLFNVMDRYDHETAQLFLDYDADIEYVGPDGDTLLHAAIKNHFDIGFIKTLLKRHLPVNAINNKMLTPLLIACKDESKNQLEVVKALLDHDANVHCTDESLMTPLHIACQNKNLEVVTALLEKGAVSNIANNKGQTPLHLACEQRYALCRDVKIKIDNVATSRIIRLLLQYNANIEAVDAKGWTPLFVACDTGNNQALKVLLNNHADADHTDLEDLTPLYIAANSGSKVKACADIIRILLKHKVYVHCIDKQGNSVIHLIAETGFPELIKYLARTQINFNPINKQRDTALHIAVQKGSVEMTKRLIKYGANVNIFNGKNQTPLVAATDYMFDYKNKCEDYRLDISSGDSDDKRRNIKMYESYIRRYKKIIKILQIQVIKLDTAGLKINNTNFEIVKNHDFDESSDDESSDDDFFDSDDVYDKDINKIFIPQLEVQCEREIKKMRNIDTGVNSMTFYDLLTKNIHFLCRFVKNKKLRQTLELSDYDKKFPLYMDIVRSRFRDAKFRYRMMDSAKKYFLLNVTRRLSDDCINRIFSYLTIKELKMTIRALMPLDD